jgi:hypothetical protein
LKVKHQAFAKTARACPKAPKGHISGKWSERLPDRKYRSKSTALSAELPLAHGLKIYQ